MKELLVKYPKTTALVKDFYMEKLLNSMKGNENLPEDFKEFAKLKGIDDENVIMMMEAAPRQMFDVFDAHEIYVEIGLGRNFRWRIGENSWSKDYEFRIGAEKDAIAQAYELLENKLNDNAGV